jgi:hypothetical protein
MSLDDHRIARGKSGGCISPSNGEGERKVARAENHDRTERTQNGADVGSREWCAPRLGRIHSSCNPRPVFDYLRKETELVCGSSEFSLKALFRQGGLAMRSLDQLSRNAVDSRGDVTKKSALLPARQLAVNREGFPGQIRCEVYMFVGSGMEGWFKASSRGRIEAIKGGSGSLRGLAVHN